MILITGGTGFIGRHVVSRLMAEGRAVRLLLPAEKQAQLPWETPPEIVTGTILDDEALFRAMSGVHTVIHLENAQWWGRPRDLERIELAGTQSVITAARAARIGRIITLSHLGAAPSAAYSLMRYKGLVEDVIRTSGLAYTILRTGVIFGEEDSFVNHIAMQLRAMPFVFFMPGQGEVVLHPLHIEDLVSAIVGSLEAIATVDMTIEIGGPEYITLEDLIRTVMRVSNAPRMIIPVPPYVLRWVAAFSTRLLPRALMTSQWFDILATNRTARLGNIFDYFRIRPRRLEDTLMTYMRGERYFVRMLRYTLRRRPHKI